MKAKSGKSALISTFPNIHLLVKAILLINGRELEKLHRIAI